MIMSFVKMKAPANLFDFRLKINNFCFVQIDSIGVQRLTNETNLSAEFIHRVGWVCQYVTWKVSVMNDKCLKLQNQLMIFDGQVGTLTGPVCTCDVFQFQLSENRKNESESLRKMFQLLFLQT